MAQSTHERNICAVLVLRVDHVVSTHCREIIHPQARSPELDGRPLSLCPITPGMSLPEFELIDANPDWSRVLGCYHSLQQQSTENWIPRVAMVAEVPSDKLSAIHGKLIALGFLRFDLAPRAEGVVYQLTPQGKQALVPPAERQLVPDWMLVEEAA